MKGIDLSENNGNVDLVKVKNDGIEFAILRVGWIGNKNNHTLDKKFIQFITKCNEIGLPVGIYVYNYCKSVDTLKQGANWVVEQINKYKTNNIKYPIFLDMEDSSITGCGKTNLTNQCIEFCKIIENAGFKAGVYANKNWFYNYLDINKLLNYKIWLAEWNRKNNHTANFRVDFWQYADNGKVNGITGNVDMNKSINYDINETKVTNKGGFEMKIYQNGTTKEIVYQDLNCTQPIGYMHPHEVAECYGIINNKALIIYNVDLTNNKKTGFVKWLGGIIN